MRLFMIVLVAVTLSACGDTEDSKEYQAGYSDGYVAGREDGFEAGYADGHEAGHLEGFEEGKAQVCKEIQSRLDAAVYTFSC